MQAGTAVRSSIGADDEGLLSMGGQCRGRGQGRSAARRPTNHTNVSLRKHDRLYPANCFCFWYIYPLCIIIKAFFLDYEPPSPRSRIRSGLGETLSIVHEFLFIAAIMSIEP